MVFWTLAPGVLGIFYKYREKEAFNCKRFCADVPGTTGTGRTEDVCRHSRPGQSAKPA
jgi:hypothetical protein